MPTLAQIRDAIAATMVAVPDIGKYDHQGQIRGWNIRRLSRSEKSTAVGISHVVNKWRISGFMSLSDADESELAFDGLLEDLCAAFRADETLGGLITGTVLENPNVAGLQIEDSGPVMFAGVLCHSARGILYTWHRG